MAKSEFSGGRLKLVRSFHGLSQTKLAKQVGVTQAYISQLEGRRTHQLDDQTLHALCEVLGVTPTFFGGRDLPVPREGRCHFRRRATAPKGGIAQALAHVALFRDLVCYFEEIVEWPLVDIPGVTVAELADVDRAAERLRLHCGYRADEPIADISHVAEHAGAVVTRFPLTPKVDAFSLGDEGRPVIILSSADPASRSVWNVAHEMGHLVLHDQATAERRVLELQADRFAAALLLPRAAFIREWRGSRVQWSHVFQMKRRWQVSAAAIVRRAKDLGLITASAYRGANIYYRKNGWHRCEPHEPEFAAPALLHDAFELVQDAHGRTPQVVAEEDLGWLPLTLERVVDPSALPASPDPTPTPPQGGNVVPLRTV